MSTGSEDVPGYRVQDVIGRGGFSVVYRAYQAELDRLVALKVLSVQDVEEKVMRRFRREARIAGRLTGHPNIVTVLDTGLTRSGRPYIAMDLFEQGSLRDRLKAHGPMPVGEVLRAGVKIAGALAAAHDAGILHGDVKPQNILLSRFGEYALADFGIARLINHDASSLTGAFTPHHAAPEVIGGQAPTAAADLYSLGSTLYHLLAGRPPFYRAGDTGVAPLLLRIVAEEPPPVGRDDVPARLVAVISQAMAKDPARRFPDAPAFAAELQVLQQELSEPVTESAHSPRLPPPQTVSARPVGEEGAGGTAPTKNGETSETKNGETKNGETKNGETESGETESGETVLRPRWAAEPPSSQVARRRRGRTVVVAAVITVIGGLAVGVAVRSALARPHPAPSASTTPAVADPKVLDAARPQHLVVTDNGASVVLHWTLGDADRFPIFLQRSPADPAGLRALGDGARTTTVTGLDPKEGYCFTVGAVVAFGSPSAVAWSRPACIRGAVPD